MNQATCREPLDTEEPNFSMIPDLYANQIEQDQFYSVSSNLGFSR